MTQKDSHKKPILQESPQQEIYPNLPTFNEDRFDDSIFDKGYECFVEKAVRCPCYDIASGAAMLNCCNCGGNGWLFINKKKTRLLIQNINRQTKFISWTEQDRGTISITGRGYDRLAFMDRITILDVASIFSQKIVLQQYGDKKFGYLMYYPLNISDVFMFNNPNEKLIPLTLTEDYTIEENKIILNSTKYKNYQTEHLRISVRYYHNPMYYVIDIPREVSMIRNVSCETSESYLNNNPINAIGRKAHFVIDSPNVLGDSLFDNSVYNDQNTEHILETINPNSLLFWVINSSAQQIKEALYIEGDSQKIVELKTIL